MAGPVKGSTRPPFIRLCQRLLAAITDFGCMPGDFIANSLQSAMKVDDAAKQIWIGYWSITFHSQRLNGVEPRRFQSVSKKMYGPPGVAHRLSLTLYD